MLSDEGGCLPRPRSGLARSATSRRATAQLRGGDPRPVRGGGSRQSTDGSRRRLEAQEARIASRAAYVGYVTRKWWPSRPGRRTAAAKTHESCRATHAPGLNRCRSTSRIAETLGSCLIDVAVRLTVDSPTPRSALQAGSACQRSRRIGAFRVVPKHNQVAEGGRP